MKLLLIALFAGILAAADPEPVWDHLPEAVYYGEDLHLALRSPDLSTAQELVLTTTAGERRATRHPDGGFRLSLPVTPAVTELRLALADRAWRVALLGPGSATDQGPTSIDPSGRLRTAAGAWAVLALERREATEDRRFAIFRPPEARLGDDRPCELHLPSSGQEPDSGILATLLASRALAVAGQGIVIELPTADAWRGWDHRQYRQAAAWLVADLLARQARRVVLIQPPMVALEEELIAGLRRQIYDVGRSYRCEVVATTQLAEARFWEVAPGVLGRWPNPEGRARLDALCAPYLATP